MWSWHLPLLPHICPLPGFPPWPSSLLFGVQSDENATQHTGSNDSFTDLSPLRLCSCCCFRLAEARLERDFLPVSSGLFRYISYRKLSPSPKSRNFLPEPLVLSPIVYCNSLHACLCSPVSVNLRTGTFFIPQSQVLDLAHNDYIFNKWNVFEIKKLVNNPEDLLACIK